MPRHSITFIITLWLLWITKKQYTSKVLEGHIEWSTSPNTAQPYSIIERENLSINKRLGHVDIYGMVPQSASPEFSRKAGPVYLEASVQLHPLQDYWTIVER